LNGSAIVVSENLSATDADRDLLASAIEQLARIRTVDPSWPRRASLSPLRRRCDITKRQYFGQPVFSTRPINLVSEARLIDRPNRVVRYRCRERISDGAACRSFHRLSVAHCDRPFDGHRGHGRAATRRVGSAFKGYEPAPVSVFRDSPMSTIVGRAADAEADGNLQAVR
jgi:hypothetical protein